MATPLKYYVGINIKNDRRQVFGAHGKPTAKSHGKHFSAVIGPFSGLRAALYVRDYGFNNPKIRCPADAEKLCRVRSAPTFQRTHRKLKRRKIRRVKRKHPRGKRFRSARPPTAARAGRRRARRRKVGRPALRAVASRREATHQKHRRRRNPVSRRRAGERQGDIFARVQEPFRLAGEKGTDHERRQREKESKAKATRDFATRNQLDFETNPARNKSKVGRPALRAVASRREATHHNKRLRVRKLSPAQLRAGFGGKARQRARK